MKPSVKIPKEWLQWINLNLEKGVSKDYVFNTLLENGFSFELVSSAMRYEPEIKQSIPDNWKAWLKQNISQGGNKDGLFKVLMMHGFSFDSIKEEMQYTPSVSLDSLKYPFKETSGKNAPKYQENKFEPLLIPNATKLESDKLDIFVVASFLSDIECEHLVKLMRNKLHPSTLATKEEDKFFRTSSTCNLTEFDDDLVKNIDARICNLVNVAHQFSEPMQGQFYQVGQEFKPHTDFFEDSELERNGKALGQRTHTVMVYLNTTEAGGETAFPLIDKEFSPEEGKAIIWSNLDANGAPNQFSLHHAKKVRRGYKAIVTKWFRTGIPWV